MLPDPLVTLSECSSRAYQATLLLGLSNVWLQPQLVALNVTFATAPAPGDHCAGPNPSTCGPHQLPASILPWSSTLPTLQAGW